MIKAIIISLRPKQWTKNLFVFAGLIFANKFLELSYLFKSVAAFLAFCLLSGAVYLINDVIDMDDDRKHLTKRSRPIASGEVSVPLALCSAAALTAISLASAYYLNLQFFYCAVSYLVLMFLYSLVLKKVVFLDVFSIAVGFVLRAVAGIVVIAVAYSAWIVICTLLLSLLIALGKRRCELMRFAHGQKGFRGVLKDYNSQLLDQLISAVAGATIIAYSLYTLWPDTVERFHTHDLVYSVPFVLYGIFRYLYLIYKKGKGGYPEELPLTDMPLTIDILLWMVIVLLIIYFKGL